MIYCNWCEAEALKVIVFNKGRLFPVCLHCAYIFEFGQNNFEALLEYLEDMAIVQQEDGTYRGVNDE